MLGCNPQEILASISPVLRPKKESGVHDRDMNDLMDGRAYMSEARSWSDTPPYAGDIGQDMTVGFTEGWEGLPLIGGITSGWLFAYQGNQQWATPFTASDKSNH